MAISYDNLWKLLIDKKLKRTDLKSTCGISSNVLAKLGKNEPVSMENENVGNCFLVKNMFSIGLQHRRYNAIC